MIFGGRQANAPVVGVERPIEFVEPVAGIVAVAIQRFGAQRILASLEKRHTLRQRYHAHAHVVHSHSRLQRGGDRRFELDRIKQGFVVMRFDIRNHFLRIERVASRLAVVIHVRAGGDYARAR